MFSPYSPPQGLDCYLKVCTLSYTLLFHSTRLYNHPSHDSQSSWSMIMLIYVILIAIYAAYPYFSTCYHSPPHAFHIYLRLLNLLWHSLIHVYITSVRGPLFRSSPPERFPDTHHHSPTPISVSRPP